MPQEISRKSTAPQHVDDLIDAAHQHGESCGPRMSETSSVARSFMTCLKCQQQKLKCDRIKPYCSICTSRNHKCEYPKRKRKPDLKRRSYKQLQSKLLEIESNSAYDIQRPTHSYITKTGSEESDTGARHERETADVPPAPASPRYDKERSASQGMRELFADHVPLHTVDSPTQGLVRLGIHEALPSTIIQQELFQIYFSKIHHQMPIIHKYNFLAALELGVNLRPPTCLLYSMWAVASSASSRYEHLAEAFYQRARWYAEEAEMMGRAQDFVTIYVAQCWCLITKYETSKTYFTRAWMSSGRFVRLVEMMNLSCLDEDGPASRQMLKPAEGVIEQEIRRRTFWMAFCADRWASAGTGWPLAIAESNIRTNLPCSEDAFENGMVEETISLDQGLQREGVPKLSSPLTGIIVASVLYGRNYAHIHSNDPSDRPEDFTNGAYWKRHREMDSTLSTIFLRLPDNLKLPRGINNMEVVFLNLTFHASSISLHQASFLTAEKHGLNPSISAESLRRCLVSADEIVHTMRLISHQDPGHMDAILGFCLYIAGSVYIYDLRRGQPPSPRSRRNLHCLIAALYAVRQRLPIMSHFSAQIEFDLEETGVAMSPQGTQHSSVDNSGLVFLDAVPAASAAYIGTSNIAEIRKGRFKILSPISGIVSRDWTECAIRADVNTLSRGTTQ